MAPCSARRSAEQTYLFRFINLYIFRPLRTLLIGEQQAWHGLKGQRERCWTDQSSNRIGCCDELANTVNGGRAASPGHRPG